MLALVDLNLTLLLRTRNEEVEGIEPSFSLQGKLHERDAVYHVYLRPFATELMRSLLGWQQAGMCQVGFYTQFTQEMAFGVIISLLKEATQSEWKPLEEPYLSSIICLHDFTRLLLFDSFFTEQDIEGEERSKIGKKWVVEKKIEKVLDGLEAVQDYAGLHTLKNTRLP